MQDKCTVSLSVAVIHAHILHKYHVENEYFSLGLKFYEVKE